MQIFKEMDPLILTSAAIVLFLGAGNDPWWSVTGASNDKLLSVSVSPYYLHTAATGIASTVPFAGFLGTLTRVLLLLTFMLLGSSSLSPQAWWREVAVYFSLSALSELYLSFFLLYHAAGTTLLGAYGILPPFTGTIQLPTVIIGLDLVSYAQPLVAAGFTLPFYLGFLCVGLVGASQLVKNIREKRSKRERRGVAALFTSDDNHS
jgi:hypothetical protein